MNIRNGIATAALLILLNCGIFVVFAAAQQSPQIIWQLPYTLDKNYLSLKFTADSNQLIGGGEMLSGGSSNGVLIKRFAAATGAEIITTPISFIYSGASEIALSPDEQKIVTANLNTRCTAAIPPTCEGGYLQYETQELERTAVPPQGNAANYSVDYSPNGELIALGGIWFNYGPTDYFNLRLVRADDLSIVRTMQGHLRSPNDGGTLSVRFSPDGTLLGTSGRDKFVKIWRVSDGALLRSINFDDAYIVDSVSFSPDGQFIAAGRIGYEAQVKVWRVATGELVKTFDAAPQATNTHFNKVVWTRDGNHIVAGLSYGVGSGSNKIKFWNFQSGELVRDFPTQEDRFIRSIVFSPDGQKFAWAASSQIFVAANPFPGVAAANSKTFCDFDGDRKSDVSVFRNGMWYLQESAEGFRAARFGLETDKIVPADYDGDGKTDVAVYRGGTWYLQRSSLGFTALSFGSSDDIPVPADYDGDGKADIAVFRPSSGTWYLQRSQLGFTGIAFGQNGDKPVPADYDGDGKTDIAVNRAGIWYLNRSQAGFAGIQFGDGADKPVPADYDGDGKTDIAVFRPSNGTWYLLNSTDGFVGFNFGFGTDVPVPADYDGDGKADIAVFRNGTWYLNQTRQGFNGMTFGADGDVPIPAIR